MGVVTALAADARELARTARRARRALDKLRADTEAEPIVGVAEAAEFLGVAKPKLWRLIQQDRMPATIGQPVSGQLWLREELRPLRDELAAGREA